MADDAFTDGDEPPSAEQIAQLAGVGRATVYRHFSDRFSLADAVAKANLGTLIDALKSQDRPFRDVLRLVFSTQAAMRPLAHVMRELPAAAQERFTQRIIGLLTPHFQRAQANGEIRPDLEPGDLLMVLQMLDAGFDALPAGPDREQKAQLLIDVLSNGIFSDAEVRAGGGLKHDRKQCSGWTADGDLGD